jgi:DNA-binding response OmpR family regulator
MARILIVDDDPDFREASQLILQKEGYEIATAESRATGMQALDDFDPHLVILDVYMEQPDCGFTMVQELRRCGDMRPVIMVTSLCHVTGHDYGRDNEMVPVDAFFEKPVPTKALLATVRELLTKAGVA